ncbi:MAG: M23 family metallopeptidase [Actinobacteria bacterium]|nr:M23 family metallopeptidase [Actinomycetota bacterium]
MLNNALKRCRTIICTVLVLLVFITMLAAFQSRECACSGGSYSWPVKGRILLEFKKPTGPYGSGGHQGVDIEASTGTIVRAAGDGRVIWVGEVPRGACITVSHSGGVKTTYLDLLSTYVKSGENVRKGQEIGTVYGRRDSSSLSCHLHFSASLNGTPVDPTLLLDEMDMSSFVRLCPISQDFTQGPQGVLLEDNSPGLFSGLIKWAGRLWSDTWSLLSDVLSPLMDAFKPIGRALKELGELTWGFVNDIWDRYVFPALEKAGDWIADAAAWIWNNPYVQAVVAGLLAALAVVAIVIAGAIALSVSLVVTVAAAVAGALACIGMAVFYAVTNGGNFSFTTCFWQCFTVGIIAGTLVLSFGTLGSSFSAGLARLGISGVAKSALANGVFSAVFEASTSYLLTGNIAWKNVLVAFGIGAFVGGVTAALKAGIAPRKIFQILKLGFSRVETNLVTIGNTLVVGIRQSLQTATVVVASVKDIVLSITGKIAYVAFSGSFGVSVNVLTCALTGREITFESVAASFITGSVMGAVSLSFGTQGVQGLFIKFKVFQGGLGKYLGKIVSKGIEKVINKTLNRGLEKGFKRLSRWKEV